MLALLLTVAGAALGEEPDQVLVTYQATGERRFSGLSRSMHWTATQLGNDTVRVAVRVPIDSFESGHEEFDSLVRAALQSKRYPFVEVEGVVAGASFEGTITVRDVRRRLEMPVSIVHIGKQLIVDTSFGIDLRQFGISIPSIDPRVSIAFVARLSANPAAVLGGGTLSSN